MHVDCPRHASQSKTSLVVSLDTGLWNCFGCGLGGDVLHLAEFIETGAVSKCAVTGITPQHRTARAFLADRAGLPQLGSSTGGLEEKDYVDARAVFAAMTETATIFHERLVSDEHVEVREWLEKKYGITRETVDRLKIGWSGGHACRDEVIARGHDARHVKATGLFRFGSSPAEVHSYFKNRVVFPYWKGGQVVYAIARKTPWTEKNDYEQAKYKKLGVYDDKKRPYVSRAIKNPALYGEDILRERPDAVVLTEGITDAIAAQQAGFPTVSPVTIRLKKGVIQDIAALLARVPKVYIIQDNELSGAGLEGALDTADALEKHGTQCRLVELPLSEKCTKARQEFQELLGDEGAKKYRATTVSKKSKLLKSLLVDRPEDLKRAAGLIAASKIDLCDYLRENPGRASIEKLLEGAAKPIEIMIERAEKRDDPEEQLEAIKPILVRLVRQKAPFQSDYLKKLKATLGLDWTIADLKRAAKEAAGECHAAEDKKVRAAGGAIECNDNFLGDQFLREHGTNVRYCDQTSAWTIWDGKRWRWDLDRSIEQLARSTVERVGRIAEERAELAAKNQDESEAKRLGRFACRALSMTGVRAALDVAAGTGSLDEEMKG